MALEFVVGSAVIYGRVNKRNDGLSISIGVVEEVFGPISENFNFIINDIFEVVASK
jgi:rRNA processing protein Gar1